MLKHRLGVPSRHLRPSSISSKLGRECHDRGGASCSRLILIFTSAVFLGAMTPCIAHAQSGGLTLPDDSGTAAAANAVAIVPVKDGIDLQADQVKAAIRLASASVPAGGKVAITTHFAVAPGWHIYGAPLPAGEDLTPTSLSFAKDLAAHQSVTMPPPTPLRFEALGETLPVYQGDFTSSAELQLKPDLKPGPQTISGTLRFQECNDSLCKMPRTVEFTLPLQISG
jgi:DsbC/DsbD-like thiol-disulfide interchange protein